MTREEMLEELRGKTVVASVSGGKDSTALSLYLHENKIEHHRVFADTGWEADETYRYLDYLETVIGPITRVRAELQMIELIREWQMFPTRMGKWCTRELKLKPIFRHIGLIAQSSDQRVANVVGVRAQESAKRSKLPPLDGYCGEHGEWDIVRPIIEWPEQAVIDIHYRHGIRPNPLYMKGARRVGCWPCIFSRKDEIRLIAETDPDRIDLIRMLEREVTDANHKKQAAKGVNDDRPYTFFQSAGPEDLRVSGTRMTPIDTVVEWSRTTHGGRQLDLLGPDPDEGCLRWGMCEHPSATEGGDP